MLFAFRMTPLAPARLLKGKAMGSVSPDNNRSGFDIDNLRGEIRRFLARCNKVCETESEPQQLKHFSQARTACKVLRCLLRNGETAEIDVSYQMRSRIERVAKWVEQSWKHVFSNEAESFRASQNWSLTDVLREYVLNESGIFAFANPHEIPGTPEFNEAKKEPHSANDLQNEKLEGVAVSQSGDTQDVLRTVINDSIRKTVDDTRDAMRRAIANALEDAQPLIKEEYAKYNKELAELGLPPVEPDEDIKERALRLLRMAGRPGTDFGDLTSADVEQIARDFADQEIKAAIDRKRVKKRAAEIAANAVTNSECESQNANSCSGEISQQLNASSIKDSGEKPEDSGREKPLIPSWDSDARTLTFGNDSHTFIRRLKQAKVVLDAFQASDWQSKIPLRNDATFRKAAIRTLKKLESMIRFEFGTDTDNPNTVCWRPATSAQSAQPNCS